MRSYIKKLQSKPEEARKQVLVVWLSISMVIVGSVWMYSLSDRFGDKSTTVATQEESKGPSPFKLFVNSISSAYSNISASVSNISSSDKEDIVTTTDTKGKQIDLIPIESNYNQ